MMKKMWSREDQNICELKSKIVSADLSSRGYRFWLEILIMPLLRQTFPADFKGSFRHGGKVLE